jgi:hypothetical protein
VESVSSRLFTRSIRIVDGHWTLVHTRIDRGVEWIWYLDRRGTAREVKRAFTNLTKLDDFLDQGAGTLRVSHAGLGRVGWCD